MTTLGNVNGEQLKLFPLQIELDYPYQQSTTVLRRKVRAEDGFTYAIKGKTNENDFTPVNEWVCARIGRAIGVPTLPFELLIDKEENEYFGSQWGAGPLKSHSLHFGELEDPSLYSAIMVFDLLMLNKDRHIGDYLILEVDGLNKLVAFDHSHALLYNNPLPKPSEIDSPHRDFFVIHDHLGLRPNKKRMEAVLKKFRELDVAFFDTIVSQCSHWLSPEQTIALQKWLKGRSSCLAKIDNYVGGLL
ncbi:MAG: HipA domain-containing protein [Planctomycetes bacterium]|nr:HipA domain-containing protein [Planctomycetota bacterium]